MIICIQHNSLKREPDVDSKAIASPAHPEPAWLKVGQFGTGVGALTASARLLAKQSKGRAFGPGDCVDARYRPATTASRYPTCRSILQCPSMNFVFSVETRSPTATTGAFDRIPQRLQPRGTHVLIQPRIHSTYERKPTTCVSDRIRDPNRTNQHEPNLATSQCYASSRDLPDPLTR